MRKQGTGRSSEFVVWSSESETRTPPARGGSAFGGNPETAYRVLSIVCCLLLLAGCGGGGGETNASAPTSPDISATTVNIISDPKGMQVFLNDVYYDVTPVEGRTDVLPGVYTLKLVPPSGLEVIAPTKTDTFVVTKGVPNNYYYLKNSESSIAQPPPIEKK